MTDKMKMPVVGGIYKSKISGEKLIVDSIDVNLSFYPKIKNGRNYFGDQSLIDFWDYFEEIEENPKLKELKRARMEIQEIIKNFDERIKKLEEK